MHVLIWSPRSLIGKHIVRLPNYVRNQICMIVASIFRFSLCVKNIEPSDIVQWNDNMIFTVFSNDPNLSSIGN